MPGDVDLNVMGGRGMQLQDWLGKHGGLVERLTADAWEWGIPSPRKRPLLQLHVPKFTQLRSLDLSNIKAQLAEQLGVSTRGSLRKRQGSLLTGPSSNAAGSSSGSGSATRSIGSSNETAAVLPQLQELQLYQCHLTVQLVTQLLRTTTLTQLRWDSVQLSNDDWTEPVSLQLWPRSALWQHLQLLPKLSTLQLGGNLRAADVSPISSLQHLQRLAAVLPYHSTTAAVAAATPAGLTSLDLKIDARGGKDPDPAAPTEIRLSGLSHLHCFRGALVRMQPSTLGGVTGLQELSLEEPCHPDGLRWRPRELLAMLQHLTQLRHLEVQSCRLFSIELTSGYQCFSALTASTQLTALILAEWSHWHWGTGPVPQAAFSHMFPPERVLPHLKTLSLRGCMYSPVENCKPCVEAAQVAMIAARCPALQELELEGVTDWDFDCSCLLQLPLGVKKVDGLGWPGPWSRPNNGADAKLGSGSV